MHSLPESYFPITWIHWHSMIWVQATCVEVSWSLRHQEGVYICWYKLLMSKLVAFRCYSVTTVLFGRFLSPVFCHSPTNNWARSAFLSNHCNRIEVHQRTAFDCRTRAHQLRESGLHAWKWHVCCWSVISTKSGCWSCRRVFDGRKWSARHVTSQTSSAAGKSRQYGTCEQCCHV